MLSRAAVLAVLSDTNLEGPTLADYGGDFQMHSEWSDGAAIVAAIAEACRAREYRFAAVTDHSHGLRIASGMSMQEAAEQRRAIDAVNAASDGQFRLLQGIEANIDAEGNLDLSPEETAAFELVLAAPHSRLRKAEDQTPRMLRAVCSPSTATPTRRASSHTRRLRSRTRGWRGFRRSASSTA